MTHSVKDRPKILVVASIDTTLVVLLWAQLRAFQVAGYEVHCACYPGPNRDWLEKHGVRYAGFDIRRSISPWADLCALLKLFRYMRRERITIVHTHTPKAALLGQVAARLARVPIVVNTIHGFYFHDDMPRLSRWFYVAMAWVGGRCADFTLSQNSEDIDTAVSLGICRRDRIRFMGNGIDLSRFSPDRYDAAFRVSKRREIGVPEKTLIVGMVGRLVADKGYVELFEAVKVLLDERQDFHLLIIGPEEEHRAGRLEVDEYEKYGIGSCVRYLGPRDDMAELLACMDVFVLPSWREGFPRSAIEACAMGLPIVTTDVRGCREVVDDGVNGVLIPPRDPHALCDAIRCFLNDGDLRVRMGDAGHRRAVRDFDEQMICGRVVACYAELLNSRCLSVPEPRSDLDVLLPHRGPFVW